MVGEAAGAARPRRGSNADGRKSAMEIANYKYRLVHTHIPRYKRIASNGWMFLVY